MVNIWFVLIGIGSGLFFLFDANAEFEKQIGLTLIGTGGISLILSLFLAIGMANRHQPNPTTFVITDIFGYYTDKLIFGDNYLLVFLLTGISFTFISFMMSVFLFFNLKLTF